MTCRCTSVRGRYIFTMFRFAEEEKFLNAACCISADPRCGVIRHDLLLASLPPWIDEFSTSLTLECPTIYRWNTWMKLDVVRNGISSVDLLHYELEPPCGLYVDWAACRSLRTGLWLSFLSLRQGSIFNASPRLGWHARTLLNDVSLPGLEACGWRVGPADFEIHFFPLSAVLGCSFKQRPL